MRALLGLAFGVAVVATHGLMSGSRKRPPQVPFDAIAEAAVRADVLVIGELHGLTDGLERRVLASVAQALGARPRVLAHEALYEEWRPWLDAVNAPGYDRSHLDVELRERSKTVRRTAGAEQAYRSAARACVAALEHGYRIEALDANPGDAQTPAAREERLLRRLDTLRRGAVGSLIVAIVGEAHAEANSALIAHWSGKPPVVLLTWEPFRDEAPDGTFVLGPRTFFHAASR